MITDQRMQVSGDKTQTLIKKLGMALNELPTAHDQLWLFLLPRSSAPMDSIRVRGREATRVPLDLSVLDLLDTRLKGSIDLDPREFAERRVGILPTLSAWVRLVDDQLIEAERSFVPPYRFIACSASCKYVDHADVIMPGDAVCTGKRMDHWEAKTVASECAWLGAHLDFIKDQPWLYRMAELDQPLSITRLLRDVRSIVGSEDQINLVCLNEGCGWPVKIMSHGAWYKCTGCEGAWSFAEIRSRAEARRPITIKEAAERSGCSVRLLRDYIDQGKIKELSIKQGSAHLYDPVEVMQATVDSRYRRKRSS